MTTTAPETTELASTTRQLIWEIRDLYRELPDTIAAIAGLHATRYDRGGGSKNKRSTDTTLVGGDALVMYANGSDKTSISRTAGHAIDWDLAAAEARDAPSVLTVLTRWEDTIREAQNHPAAPTTTIDAAVAYLTTHATWTAQHFPDHDTYTAELTALRGRLRAVNGHINPPKASDAPCIDCNGQIVQRYKHGDRPEDRGLDDIRECNRCGKTYTQVQYNLAIKQRLEIVRTEDPDRLLTAAEARTLWGLSEKQLYVWEGREKITPAGYDNKGRRLYRNADIAALKTSRAA